MRVRIKSALTALAVPTLALGVGLAAAGTARAQDNANGVTLYRTFSCGGAQPGAQVPANAVGFVNFHVHRTTITMIYHLRGADPNATYSVYGYFGYCSGEFFLGTVHTNSHGVGNATFRYSAPSGQPIWTFTYDPPFSAAQGIETPVVTP